LNQVYYSFNERYLKARELFYAMKTLGFSITPKLTEEYIEAEALDANLK